MAKWIWKFGDFEKYHSMLVHSRRQAYGHIEPPVWKLYRPECAVRFEKTVETRGGVFHVRANGDCTVSLFTGEYNPERGDFETKCGSGPDIVLPSGRYRIEIRVVNTATLPAVYVDGIVESDESWNADDITNDWQPAGCSPLFTDPDRSPDVFPFVYETAEPVKVFTDSRYPGRLFDFGKEIFAAVTIGGLKDDHPTFVSWGESEEEALDREWSVVHFNDTAKDGRLTYPPYALRYLYVSDPDAEVTAQTEMLPVTYRGSFRTGEEVIDRVYDVAAYTFHLNCREFMLDGIKRDRWVWSADAYQSFFVNRYLFMDKELEKRTLTALGGGLPVVQYINTIMDYSYFWLISLWDYYLTWGDADYLRSIRPQAGAVMRFCLGRVSEDGFIRGRKGDWVFIDWAPMDKTGALLGEQVLLAQAMEAYGKILEVPGSAGDHAASAQSPDETPEFYFARAEALREKTKRYFYDEEKGVYIDSYESGNRYVSRQNNILAFLYLGISEQQKQRIYERVILNDEITPITTPYFKFYENQVHCLMGDGARLEQSLREYYGSMLELDATTLYEQYDPSERGAERFAMYGRPFEKSLCHAWSASPVYLLGRFRMGVVNTGVAYNTFEVRPMLGDLEGFEGTVPLPEGEVHVAMNKEKLRVCSSAPGGTLIFGGHRIPLAPGQEVQLDLLLDLQPDPL